MYVAVNTDECRLEQEAMTLNAHLETLERLRAEVEAPIGFDLTDAA